MTKCLLAFVLCVAAGAAQSAEFSESFIDECYERLPASSVVVEFEHGEVNYDFSKSINDLAKLKQLAPGSREAVLGLTRSTIKTTINRNFTTLSSPGGDSNCSRGVVIVKVFTEPQTVYVGREFKPETCAFNEVLKHEHEHVDVTKAHIEEVANYLRSYLPELIGDNAYFNSSSKALTKAIEDYFVKDLLPYITSLVNEVSDKHDYLDRPEVYAANQHICDNEIPKTLKRAGI